MQEISSEGFKHEKQPKKKKMIAKKDWVLSHNEVFIDIKKGDDLSKVSIEEKLINCLRKEQVI